MRCLQIKEASCVIIKGIKPSVPIAFELDILAKAIMISSFVIGHKNIL